MSEKSKSIIVVFIAIVFFTGIAATLVLTCPVSPIIYIVPAVLVFGYLAVFISKNMRVFYKDLEGAACLAPWYFKDDSPRVIKNSEPLRWRFVEKVGDEYAGMTVLEDPYGKCYAILKIYTCFLPFEHSTKFLVWNRSLKKHLPQEVEIFMFDTEALKEIQDPEKTILEFKNNDPTFWISAEPSSVLKCKIDPTKEVLRVAFPVAFKLIDEFIMVADLENLYENPEKRWNITAILVFRPKEDNVYIYPQDWFNKADRDFGYEWITRAARDRKSGLIRGEGIRINKFILDNTNRQVKKYLI